MLFSHSVSYLILYLFNFPLIINLITKLEEFKKSAEPPVKPRKSYKRRANVNGG